VFEQKSTRHASFENEQTGHHFNIFSLCITQKQNPQLEWLSELEREMIFRLPWHAPWISRKRKKYYPSV